MPEISIIVPCFNQANFLPEALESVLNQTYKSWECIIVDDGSTDEIKAVAEKWSSIDERYRYIHQENKGVSSARNYGIANSSGNYILPLDADDKISQDYLLSAITKFESNPSLKVVYAKAELFGSETGIWELEEFSRANLARNNMIYCSGLFRKEDWKRVGGYDPNMDSGLEDWEFWISMLKDGGEVERLDFVGFYYRKKISSRSTNLNNQRNQRLLEYMSVKHADFFVEQFGSFQSFDHQFKNLERDFNYRLKSEKFVLDLFFKRFFGFTLFKKYKGG